MTSVCSLSILGQTPSGHTCIQLQEQIPQKMAGSLLLPQQCIPICEVNILTKKQTSVISGPPLSIKTF